MATPAEHYAEAERWLRLADEHAQAAPLGDRVRTPAAVATFDSFVQRAQVHATLATVDPEALHKVRGPDFAATTAWPSHIRNDPGPGHG